MVTPSLETAVAGSGTGPEMPIPQPLKPLRAPTAAPRPKPPPAPQPKVKSATAEKPHAVPRELPENADKLPIKLAESAGQEPQPRSGVSPAPDKKPPSAPSTTIAADACVLMIHLDVADLLEESDQVRLQQMLLAHTGWRVAVSVTIGGGSAMADQAIALIRNAQWEAPPPRVAIVQDGSQPPITEHLRFLRAVRAQAGEQAQILLALVGDPEGEDPLPPLSDFDFGDWQRKIEQMADPYLRLEMLSPPANDPAPEKEASR